MRVKFVTLIMMIALPSIAQAQTTVSTSTTVAKPEMAAPAAMAKEAGAPLLQKLTLPANTEIAVTPATDFTSKRVKVGHVFDIMTVFDVTQNGIIVIPKGTGGKATVTYRTGKGAFGKSAKLEVSFNSLDLGGRQIPLTGVYRQSGDGNTGATLGAVAAAGLIGGVLVTGKSAKIPHGRQLQARTTEALSFETTATAASLAGPAKLVDTVPTSK